MWGGVFAKLAPITNTARDWYIFRWNLEYWSGLTHADPGGSDDVLWNLPYDPKTAPFVADTTDTTFLAKTPAGFSMLNNYGSVGMMQLHSSVHWSMKKKRAMTNLQTGQKVRWNTSWEKIR